MAVDPNPDFTKLFDSTGIALVHIPKTGGTSLSFALYGRGVWHRRWDQIRDADPEGFKRWHKVAVVRDPVDRFLSAFSYLKAGGSNEFDRFISRRFLRGDLAHFLDILRERGVDHPVMKYWHFRPQAEFVLSSSGRLMVDRLIQFEHLNEGARSLGISELPRLNSSSYKSAGGIVATPAIRARIESLYERDAVILQSLK